MCLDYSGRQPKRISPVKPVAAARPGKGGRRPACRRAARPLSSCVIGLFGRPPGPALAPGTVGVRARPKNRPESAPILPAAHPITDVDAFPSPRQTATSRPDPRSSDQWMKFSGPTGVKGVSYRRDALGAKTIRRRATAIEISSLLSFISGYPIEENPHSQLASPSVVRCGGRGKRTPLIGWVVPFVTALCGLIFGAHYSSHHGAASRMGKKGYSKSWLTGVYDPSILGSRGWRPALIAESRSAILRVTASPFL
jgi:hypothetical protein